MEGYPEETLWCMIEARIFLVRARMPLVRASPADRGTDDRD